MAAVGTVQLNVTGNASQQLASINKQVEGLNKSFGGLKSALAGLALGSFISNALRASESLVNLSRATGVSVEQIDSLGRALRANGGSAEDTTTIITKFSQTLEKARTGSKDAQLALRQLGVGLDDLKQADEKVLGQTLDALAKMPPSAKRTALAMEILGKSVRAVDFTKLTEDQRKFYEESQRNASSIKAAAELQNKLTAAIDRLRIALLKTLEPLANAINKIPEDKINDLIDSFTKMALAIAGLAGAAKVVSLIGGGLLALRGYIFLITDGIKILKKTLKITTGQVGGFKKAWKDATTVLQKAFAVLKFIKTFLIKRLPWVILSFGKMALGIAAVSIALYGIREALKFLFNVDIFKPIINAWNWIVDKAREYLGLHRQIADQAADIAPEIPEPEEGPPIEDAFKDVRQNILGVVDAYKKQNAEIIRNNDLERLYLGMKEDQVEVERAITDLFDRQQDAIKKLNDEKEKLSDTQKEEKAFIQNQIDLLNQQYEEEKKLIIGSIDNLQKKRKELEEILHLNQMIGMAINQAEALTQLEEELALIGLYGEELEKQQELMGIERTLRKEILSISQDLLDLAAKEATMNADEFQREIERHQERIRMAYELRDAQISTSEQSRAKRKSIEQDYSEGVRRGLEDIAKDMKPIVIAQRAVENGWGQIENALDKFVETGKLNFADLARSIILDLTKMIAKALIFKAIQTAIGAVFPGLKIPGMQKGGTVSKDKPYMVGEQGPELFVPRTSGQIVPNNKLGGGQVVNAPVTNNNTTYNISAIDAKSVAQFFYENRKAMLGTVTMAQKELPYRA